MLPQYRHATAGNNMKRVLFETTLQLIDFMIDNYNEETDELLMACNSDREKLETRFNYINKTEVELDELLEDLNTRPSCSIAQKIKEKVAFVEKILQKNIPDFIELITNCATKRKFSRYFYPFHREKYIEHLNESKNAFYMKLNESMLAIYVIEAKAKEFLSQFPTHNQQTSIVEQSMMPNINSFAQIASSHLGNALRAQGHDEKLIRQIIQVNATTLAQSMYGEEENSLVVRKLDGMRNHYMELAQEREMQMEYYPTTQQQESPAMEQIAIMMQHLISENQQTREAFSCLENKITSKMSQEDQSTRPSSGFFSG